MASVIVVGGGVIGLTTAVELLDRGHDVEIWARDDVSDTVSAIAAAVWYPYLAKPRDRVLRWSGITFERLLALSRLPQSGVAIQQLVELFADPEPDLWWLPTGVEVRRVDVRQFGASYRAGIEVGVPLCDTTTYLPWLVGTVRERGGAILRREVTSLDEALEAAPIVANCTGLAARELCGDSEVKPVRGQVVSVAPTGIPFALIDDTDASHPVYVLPRANDIVLGGTATLDDDRIEIDDADTESIRSACARRLSQLCDAEVRSVRVGLRPYRREVRLASELRPGGRYLIHNYGHGGAGFTLAWGCAAEVATLVREIENGVPGCRKDGR